MIQELFGGGASFLGGERKICFNGILEGSPSPSPSLSTSSNNTTVSSTPTTPTTATANTAGGDQQNLRCPRCDSSNTKFCYYNNYNLTQPRHFCKTCRRYWTKGGALRNVPIGGGCRKNKSPLPSPTTTTAVKSTNGKSKTSCGEFGKPNFGFDLDPPINPILWATPQNSQLMALLRAAQNQNPNPNSVRIKQEEAMIGSYNIGTTSSALNARPNGGVDPFGQTHVGMSDSFWRNNQHQNQNPNQPQQHGLIMGDLQATGIQELFQRLRSTGNYYPDQVGNNAAPVSSTFMEPSPITGAEVGYWNNPSASWSNLPTPHGAFP